MKRIEIVLLFIILLAGFVVRMYRFDFPIADWHSWRQVDTSMVSRNFIKHGFTIFVPRYDDLSKNVSLIDNPEGYRFVEFPLYNLFQAGFFTLFNTFAPHEIGAGFTLEQWGRLISIGSSLITTLLLYLLAKKYISPKAGIAAAFFYALLPYNIYYGRTVLPDTTMVATLIGGFYFLDKWLERQKFIFYILAVTLCAVALLLKPFALFFMFPFLYIIFRRFGLNSFTNLSVWIFVIGTLIPLVVWRLWMSQYPQGVPRNDWLFNGNNIRFKGSFFNWIFAERISRMILGYFGLPLVIIGILSKIKKEGLILYGFLAGSLLFVTVLATGNVQHDYYQILIVPTLALFFAKGVDVVLDRSSKVFNVYVSGLVVVVSSLFMLAFGWFIIRDFYTLQHYEIVTAGQAVDKLVPKDAKIIAPFGGDTTFLYHTNRKGWPVFDRELPEFIRIGATHMVFVNPKEPELNFQNYFKTVERNPSYVIYDLRVPLRPLTDKISATHSAIINPN